MPPNPRPPPFSCFGEPFRPKPVSNRRRLIILTLLLLLLLATVVQRCGLANQAPPRPEAVQELCPENDYTHPVQCHRAAQPQQISWNPAAPRPASEPTAKEKHTRSGSKATSIYPVIAKPRPKREQLPAVHYRPPLHTPGSQIAA